jgi:glycerol-3-phosphate dehydrogenase (NAD(P)+)
MQTFAVLGAGAWGTALACHLAARPGRTVRLWAGRASSAADLLAHRENRRQLPDVPIPAAVRITADPGEAAAGADCWVTAIPCAFLRQTLQPFRGLLPPDCPVVSVTKGIEIETFARPSEILAEVLGADNVVALSGPSHAEEVARGQPTSLVAACAHGATAEAVQASFGSSRLRIYTNLDLLGVELAGALKNVIAIAAGVSDGLGFGDNAKSALLTRGLVEICRFGSVHGAEPGTFHGLAGLGDLVTTCFSPHGRNRRVGAELASGTATLADVLARPQVAEGVYTAKSVYHRVAAMGVEMPIVAGVYEVLYEGKSPRDAVRELLARGQRGENTFLG